MLSLLTCLLDNRFPKAIPYVYQVVALAGFGHLLISREFLAIFGKYTRFWYCFFYLIVALANIVAANIYFAVSKGSRALVMGWFGAITFPTILVSTFFVSQYSLMPSAVLNLSLQIGVVLSAFLVGISMSIFLKPEFVKKLFRRKLEVK